jgi:hypothetical protein
MGFVPGSRSEEYKSGVGAKIGVESTVLGVAGSERTQNERGMSEGTLEVVGGELQ